MRVLTVPSGCSSRAAISAWRQTLEVRELDCGSLQQRNSSSAARTRATCSDESTWESTGGPASTTVTGRTIVGRAGRAERSAPAADRWPGCASSVNSHARDCAARRAVACRLAPGLREDLLHDIFGFGGVAENPQRQRVDRPGMAVVELRHGVTVAPAMRASAA